MVSVGVWMMSVGICGCQNCGSLYVRVSECCLMVSACFCRCLCGSASIWGCMCIYSNVGTHTDTKAYILKHTHTYTHVHTNKQTVTHTVTQT